MIHWLDQDIEAAIYMLEEGRNSHLMRALAMRVGGAKLAWPDWVKDHPDEVSAVINEHREWLDDLGRRIWHAPKAILSLDGLEAWVRKRAKTGCRIIVVDPATAAQVTDKPWVSDQKFVVGVKSIAEEYGCSVVLAIHPKLGTKRSISLDHLAGGAAYPRLAQCVLVLGRHSPRKAGTVATNFGSLSQSYGRSLWVRKARHGRGAGLEYAFDFKEDSLSFQFLGPVANEEEESQHPPL